MKFLATLAALSNMAKARTPFDVLAEVIGLGTVAYGVGMIFLPAGVIVAGVSLCFIGYALGGDPK
jgi:hypothetical protein